MSQRQKMFQPTVVVAILKKTFGESLGNENHISMTVKGHLEINNWRFDSVDDQTKIRLEFIAEPSIGYIEVKDIETKRDNRPSSTFFDLSAIYHLHYMQ